MAPAGDWLRPQGVETCRDPRAVSGPAVRVLWRPMESMNGGRRSSPLASLAGACTMATLLLKVQLTVICEWSYWLSAPCPCSLSPPWSGARSAAWVQALAPLPAAHVCSPSSPFLPLLLLTALLLPGLEVDSVFSFFNLQFLVGKFHLKLLHSFFFFSHIRDFSLLSAARSSDWFTSQHSFLLPARRRSRSEPDRDLPRQSDLLQIGFPDIS